MSDAIDWLLRFPGVTRVTPDQWARCPGWDCSVRGDFHVYATRDGHAATRDCGEGRLFECTLPGDGGGSEWTLDVCRRWCDAHLDPLHPRDGLGQPLPYFWDRRWNGGGWWRDHPLNGVRLEVALVGPAFEWRQHGGLWTGPHLSREQAMLAALGSVGGTFFDGDTPRPQLLWDRQCTCGHLRAHHERGGAQACCVGVDRPCECERFAERGP